MMILRCVVRSLTFVRLWQLIQKLCCNEPASDLVIKV
jgi:hypothetical protein